MRVWGNGEACTDVPLINANSCTTGALAAAGLRVKSDSSAVTVPLLPLVSATDRVEVFFACFQEGTDPSGCRKSGGRRTVRVSPATTETPADPSSGVKMIGAAPALRVMDWLLPVTAMAVTPARSVRMTSRSTTLP